MFTASPENRAHMRLGTIKTGPSEGARELRSEARRVVGTARKCLIEKIAVKGMSDCRVEWGCTAVTAWCFHAMASHKECSVDSRL